MITTHQYLNKYPISKGSKKLILGTIHPHDHQSFKIPFFYENVTSLWKIFSQAFPNELAEPFYLEGILAFLRKRKISISDTIVQCRRKNPTSLDKDLIPIELNKRIIEDIKNSQIAEILFTSGFGKNNAFKMFYKDILGLKISPEIKKNRCITLDKEYFGRPVKLTVLYSPSGMANAGISRSNLFLMEKEKYKGSKTPVKDFKVDYYRKLISST